jgi:hypothetical protein
VSQAHLVELRTALEQRGWCITERLRGEDGAIGAGTWELKRSGGEVTHVIDFDGLGAMGEDLPIEESYGCRVRGTLDGLYFRRINRSRDLWLADLRAFASSLDE